MNSSNDAEERLKMYRAASRATRQKTRRDLARLEGGRRLSEEAGGEATDGEEAAEAAGNEAADESSSLIDAGGGGGDCGDPTGTVGGNFGLGEVGGGDRGRGGGD